MKAIILAAGKGERLQESPQPKALTPLANGQSILERQVSLLTAHLSLESILIVVGYEKERIHAAFPSLPFVTNLNFATTNTAKSLALALEQIEGEDLLWLNGDVVFHPTVLEKILTEKRTSMVVNQATVGSEEVKYQTDSQGRISAISKELEEASGEALGINFCTAADLPLFKKHLASCGNSDYFEKGMELSIREGLAVWPVVVEESLCTEIDFQEDLMHANELLTEWN